MRQTLSALFASAFCLIAIIGMVFFIPVHNASKDCAQAEYKVVSFNVHSANARKDDVVRFLQDQNPDIIALYEIDSAWISALQALDTNYPHRIVRPSEDNFGIGVWSRHELKDPAIEFSPLGIPSIHALIGTSADAPMLFAIHPLPPINSFASADRNTVLQAVGDAMGQDSQRTQIVVGDFNATAWSWPLRNIIRQQGLESLWPYAWSGTWPSPIRHIGIPIDHALGRHVACASGEVAADLGSDHRPLIIHFSQPSR